jgi:hypothetical protein
VYAAVAADRVPGVVAAVGCAGCALLAVALMLRRPSVVPVALALVGGAYGVYVSFRGAVVDPRAPLVAAALFLAAETASWSLEPGGARPERSVALRRAVAVAAGAVATGLVGSLVLVAASGRSGGVGLEAAGVAAAEMERLRARLVERVGP